MDYIKSIQDILSGAFADLKESPKTDRVLKSTKIEQEIFNDLYNESMVLPSCEKDGARKLKSFPPLVRDVFQSVYALKPRFTDVEELSAISKEFNKNILENLMSDEQYSAIKSVCEGKELPSMGATEEFVTSICHNLSSLMNKATGGKGQVNGLDIMEQDKQELTQKLMSEIEEYKEAVGEEKGKIGEMAMQTAKRISDKAEQLKNFTAIVQKHTAQNQKAVRAEIAKAVGAALEKANDIRCVLASWGNDAGEMHKNPINTEILKRVAKSEKLRYISKFLGRYKELLSSKRLAGYTYGRGEKYDIEYGNNISKCLTSELVMLSSPELVPLFIRKYQNKALKQYRRREPEFKGKGDIIVCLDESHSTFGENNAYGMAIAMVLFEICRINKANFALVHFSTKTKVDYFPKDKEIDTERIMDCAEIFLSGGTDFEQPLREVFALNAKGQMAKPDIVFITDGQCDLPDDFLEVFDNFKKGSGAKLTGILLDYGENIDFSLKKFADCIYRTSELLKDEIMEKLIDERI